MVVADASGTTTLLADTVTCDRLRGLRAEVATTYGVLFELYSDLSTATVSAPRPSPRAASSPPERRRLNPPRHPSSWWSSPPARPPERNDPWNILGWILSGLLAMVFVGAGAVKLITPRDKLVQTSRMGWARIFTNPQIKIISALEVAGGILPWLLDLAPVLTPVAGVGLAVIMIGAMVTHGRLGELKDALSINLVLLLLLLLLVVVAVVVAGVRFAQL